MQINTSNLKQNYNTDLGGCKSVNYGVPEHPPQALLRSRVEPWSASLGSHHARGQQRRSTKGNTVHEHSLVTVLVKTGPTEFQRLRAGEVNRYGDTWRGGQVVPVVLL